MSDKATLQAKQMVWHPIKSAPMDGSQFLASGLNGGQSSQGRHYVVAHWNMGEFCGDDEDELFAYLTHWMPLPEHPNE